MQQPTQMSKQPARPPPVWGCKCTSTSRDDMAMCDITKAGICTVPLLRDRLALIVLDLYTRVAGMK